MNETLNLTQNLTSNLTGDAAREGVNLAAEGGLGITGFAHSLMNNTLTNGAANLLNGFLGTAFFTGEFLFAIFILGTLLLKWRMISQLLGTLGNYAILLLMGIILLGQLTRGGVL